MTVYLDRLLDERTSLTGIMTGLKDKAATEDRDITDAERSEITRLQERCAEIDGLLTEHQTQNESARAFAELQSKIDAGKTAKSERRTPNAPDLESTSPGRAFVESDQFRSYPGRGPGKAFEITGFPFMEQRAVITTANLAIPHFLWTPVQPVTPVSPLLEVVGRVQVTAGTVDWVEVGADPVAAVVAEGSAKPEATPTFTPKTAALDTIAHWVQITRQALADASYIQSLLETKLQRGVIRKVESEVAAAIVAATLPTASATTAEGGLLGAIREGIGVVQAAGYQPNAVVLNPADYAALDMAVMGATVAGPVTGANYWGLRPVAVSSQPAGTATVGDFATGVVYFDRGVSDVFITDSHASFFISNILVILAETRGKAAVPEPGALCECTVGA